MIIILSIKFNKNFKKVYLSNFFLKKKIFNLYADFEKKFKENHKTIFSKFKKKK